MKVCYARDYAAVSTDLRHISDIKSIDLHTSISVANLGSPYIIDFINYLFLENSNYLLTHSIQDRHS